MKHVYLVLLLSSCLLLVAAVTKERKAVELQAFMQSDSGNIAWLLVSDAEIDSITGRATKIVVQRLLIEARKERRARYVRRLEPNDLALILASDPTAATGATFPLRVYSEILSATDDISAVTIGR